jgi:hypothetical protein
MNHALLSEREWSALMFGHSHLPDARLRERLIGYGGLQATEPEASTSKACRGDAAQREGAYRLLENERVDPAGIDEGPYQHCVKACEGKRRLLAIQDTTSVKVHHAPLAEELAESGCPTGFSVHTLIIAEPGSGLPLGIADQQRWVREKDRARKDSRKKRAYEDKESVRWQHSLERAVERLGTAEALISVCDREADIYEFLAYHIENDIDFVVRASWNRRLSEEVGGLFEAAQQAPIIAQRTIQIEQRGAQLARNGQSKRDARKRRKATTQIQAAPVQLRPPKNRKADVASLDLHVVRVSELDPVEGEEPLEWLLLTSLPITTEEEVKEIVEHYECRWLIEDFHKCWKTGCRLEMRPLQSLAVVERMMAITAPIGLRILQMKFLANSAKADDTPAPLDDDEWRCLWTATSKKPIPAAKPSARWSFLALAKLGGFYDTKRTGRPGWATLWSGWATFQARLDGWRAARRAAEM